jgi:soluble lytic murein transglycosylase-like protein
MNAMVSLICALLAVLACTRLHAESIYATPTATGRMSYSNDPISSRSLPVVAMVRPIAHRLTRQSAEVVIPTPGPLPIQQGSAANIDASIPKQIFDAVKHAAQTYSVDAKLIAAVIKVESGFNRYALSHKGAQGLMQLMPGTAKRYGVTDVNDPSQNILGGTAYLRDLLTMFDNRLDLALAGYNAGENAVIRYKRQIPPYPETQHYVSSVLADYNKRASRSE